MKKLVEEVEGEGLVSLMGERVTLFGLNYIYTGKLVGVNDAFVKLENPAVVYETGPFHEEKWKDAQNLPTSSWYVMTRSIESFGICKLHVPEKGKTKD